MDILSVSETIFFFTASLAFLLLIISLLASLYVQIKMYKKISAIVAAVEEKIETLFSLPFKILRMKKYK